LSPVRNLKKGFVGEGSSPGYKGRTFEGLVDFFIRFLRLWASLDAFRNLRNLFWGFGKTFSFIVCACLWDILRNNTKSPFHRTTMKCYRCPALLSMTYHLIQIQFAFIWVLSLNRYSAYRQLNSKFIKYRTEDLIFQYVKGVSVFTSD
jgi:hypothetical protein